MFKRPRSLTLFPRRKRNEGWNDDDDDDDDDDTSPVDKINNAIDSGQICNRQS